MKPNSMRLSSSSRVRSSPPERTRNTAPVSSVLGYLLMLGIEKRRPPFWITTALWVATLLLCRAGRKTDGFKAYFPASNLDASYFYTFHDWKEDRSCSYKELTEREKALMKWLRAQTSVTHVIVAQRWRIRVTPASQRQRENDLRVFLREIRDAGKKAVVIAPTPEFPGKQQLLRFEKIFPLRHFSSEQIEKLSPVCSAESYLRINSTVLPMLYKMRDEGLCTLIEPIQTLQPGEVFRTVHNGKILMNDDNHMNPGLSIPLVQKLRPALREALR